MTLTGTSSGTMLTDGSGNYTFSGLAPGGSYTVTPTKGAQAPGSSGIDTADVLATQQHYLHLITLTGCPLAAADVDGNGMVDTFDVLAIQHFYLGLTIGIANTGKYQFSPPNRPYPTLLTDQTGQDYSSIIFGDIVSGFVYRPGDAPQPGEDIEGQNRNQSPANVREISLPNVAVETSITNFVGQVTTTAISATDKLVAFQGDFTFDERVINFESNPVRKAGLTKGSWNVSGNVMPGKGPIRTLRISAFSTDLTPLSGAGILFELRVVRPAKAAEASTDLVWAEPPDDFIFIDAALNARKPASTGHGSVQPEAEEQPDSDRADSDGADSQR